MFNEYPYINENDLNLDYVLRKIKQLEQIVNTFVATEKVTFADPILWNIATQYAKNTIVLSTSGDAYLSKQTVPSNIQLDNVDYWQEIFNFADYVRTANSNLTIHIEQNTTRATDDYAVDDWLLWDDVLYKVTVAISTDDLLVIGTNIVHFTVEDFIKTFMTWATNTIQQYKNDIDASELAFTTNLQQQFDQVLAGATVDSEVINARVGWQGTNYTNLGIAIRSQIEAVILINYARRMLGTYVKITNSQYNLPEFMTINDKYIDPLTGSLQNMTGSKCGYVPLIETGHYYVRQKSGDYGANRIYVPKFDENMSFIGYFTATSYNSNYVEFDVNASDIMTTIYIGVSTMGGDTPNVIKDRIPPTGSYFTPRIEFADRDLFMDRGYTPNGVSISNLTKTGYYTLGTGIPDLPSGVVGGSGALLVFYPSVNYNVAAQLIITSSATPEMYFRWAPVSGVASPWVKIASASELTAAIDNISDDFVYIENESYNHPIALNGNIFDREHADWIAGSYIDYEGNLVSGAFKHCFVPVPATGSYVKISDFWNFGANERNIGLYDINKNWIGAITNATGSGTRTEFTITDKNVRFITINEVTSPSIASKIFYNSNYVHDNYPLAPKLGFTTDILYAKKLISDGDSIAEAGSDLPYSRHGYFGRLQIGYQMTGTNYAVGGGTITSATYYPDSSPRHWICDSIDAIYANDPDLDYLILEGGTNDADTLGGYHPETTPPDIPVRFGSFDKNDFSGTYDKTTYCGALDTLFYKATTYFPHAKIGFIIPMQMGTDNGTIQNRRNYFDVAAGIAEKWHIPVLDIWKLSHADARLVSYYDPNLSVADNRAAGNFYGDGQHPTSYGYNEINNLIDCWIHTI